MVKVKIPMTVFKEGRAFVAYSPVLDLATSALTFEKAKSRFEEAVGIFLEELVEKGTLEEVLAGLGWEKTRREWNPPMPIYHDLADFSLPKNYLSCLN